MADFEFIIPRRPLSVQAKPRKLAAWKAFVRELVTASWNGSVMEGELRLTLVYLCKDSTPDIDNIIKPIQDALKGLVMTDDSQVADVDGHRRFLDETFDLSRLPPLLLFGIATQRECVYVRVGSGLLLEDLL